MEDFLDICFYVIFRTFIFYLHKNIDFSLWLTSTKIVFIFFLIIYSFDIKLILFKLAIDGPLCKL